MHVLITNDRLDQRPGADLFVRDLARALQKRGHFVIAYSSDPRHQVRFLERDLVAVATDLTRLPFRPDIIHARHHLDAITALVSLPGVPAVVEALGSGGLGTIVPVHPRIEGYIVPDPSSAARLTGSGIGIESISVCDFGVDLARFARIRTPYDPFGGTCRAAIYDDWLTTASPIVAAVSASFPGGGIDFMGRGLGRTVDDPENRLLGYDIVFARGPRAVEAMACGCAVVIVDERSCASLVTTDNFQSLRSAGFSPSHAQSPATVAAIESCLRNIAAPDVSAVTSMVRQTLGFDRLVDRLVAAYGAAIERNRSAAVTWDVEQEVVSRYLRELARVIKALDTDQKRSGDLPLSTVTTFLDVASGLSSIQSDLDRPHWWPDQRPAARADGT